MREFEGTVFNDCNDEIDDLIAAARANNDLTYINLNGVKLVADPALYTTRPDYTKELKWSFWKVLEHETIFASLLGEDKECPNLVPKLEALCDQLMREFDTLDHSDPRIALDWFIRLMPITWVKNVLSNQQKRHIYAVLGEHEEYRFWQHTSNTPPHSHELQGYWHVMMTLSTLKHFNLNESWLENIQNWLACKP